MGWKEFIAGLVSSLAWPGAVVVLLVLFRDEGRRLAQRLCHFKYKELELEFEKVQQQAEEIRGELTAAASVSESPALMSLEEQQVFDAVDRMPAGAILLAWSAVERALLSAVEKLAISAGQTSTGSVMRNIQMLRKHGRLSPRHASLLNEMRILRNKVAHEGETMLSITQEQAREYGSLALELSRYLEHLVAHE